MTKNRQGLRKEAPLTLPVVNDLLTTASDCKSYAKGELDEAATCS